MILNLFVISHNTLRGAAGGAVLMAELTYVPKDILIEWIAHMR